MHRFLLRLVLLFVSVFLPEVDQSDVFVTFPIIPPSIIMKNHFRASKVFFDQYN